MTLNYPANIQAGPGHNWANAISMATPIAHKGVQYGAKVVALTVLDLLTRPELVTQAWDYFNNVQTKDRKYIPLIRPEDKPAIWLNKERMEKYRPEMKKYYYDPTKYKNYLEQLGHQVSDDGEAREAVGAAVGTRRVKTYGVSNSEISAGHAAPRSQRCRLARSAGSRRPRRPPARRRPAPRRRRRCSTSRTSAWKSTRWARTSRR